MRASPWFRAFRPQLPPWLLLFTLVVAQPGCDSSEPRRRCENVEDCAAGQACVRGECQTLASCADAARERCSDDERCAAEKCQKICQTKSDCADDEVCALWSFADGTREALCSRFEGRFTPCTSDDSCDAESGFRCIEGSCRAPCNSHADCSSVGHCARVDEGTYCEPGAPALPGRYFFPCPGGRADCDTDAGFSCISSGEGDLESYCTTDCSNDEECPSGYSCGALRTVPCSDACGLRGAPDREDCAPAEEIGAGKRYECGVLAVIRRICQPRSFCNSCESDEDCLAIPGQVCARDESGAKICTVPCDPNSDSCPWGNATQCGNWDDDRGIATCSHRFGSCRGTGNGCEPCLVDSDCGSRGICSRYDFSGERFCIDLTTECDCAGDADQNGTCAGHGCPETPGKLPMICLESRSQGDPLGNRCIGASSASAVDASQRAGCWPRL